VKFPAVLALLVMLLAASTVSAHVALSSVDVHVRADAVEVAVVGQAYDFAHELGVEPPEKLMDLDFLLRQKDALVKLVEAGVIVSADGVPLEGAGWSAPAAAPDQQLIRLQITYPLSPAAGRVTVSSRLFAYDSAHQTLVNVYEGDALKTQQMLDAGRLQMEYFTTSRAGLVSIARQFGRAGLTQGLAGYNHVLFIAALFLLAAPPRRARAIAAAFSVSCLAALAIGASGRISVPAAVVAPGVALSVVYAGVDNLMIRGGRDVRVWVALAFGWVHGLALAGALAAMDRPLRGFAWGALSFGGAAEMAFLLAAAAALSLASMVEVRGARARRVLALGCSVAIAAAGAASFYRQIF
jgi:hypothetical protein